MYREPRDQVAARSKRWYNAHADLTNARSAVWKRANRDRVLMQRRELFRAARRARPCAAEGCVRPLGPGLRLYCISCAKFYKTRKSERAKTRRAA